ncbi:hypothetical protein TcCL_Unassigned04641 [Trypanosoma cruzi]|nr:hypothetical protein TcCL_Unassigned04641 [Trypanosoma cruzi]
MRTRTRTGLWLRRPFRGGMTEDCDFILLPCCERDFLGVLPVCGAALKVPGRYAYGFTPGSCTCRRVSLAVHAPTKDSPAVRGDVRWRVREETTVKRLAMARWCCEGQLCPSASRRLFCVSA